MIKKILFFTILLPLAVSSFAEGEIPNRYIFIEGTANRKDHLEFFMTNFVMEAGSAGYTVTEKKSEAAHTIKFSVTPDTTDSGGGQRQVPPDGVNQYVIRISLVRNTDDFEVLAFDFFFTDLQEMYIYNRTLFQEATLYIPPISEEDLILAQELNSRWKNKWFYIRASFDYPITFYLLQGDGLIGGIGLYEGDYGNPSRISPIDNEITAMPGATIGFEFQFLDFMSVEINYQFSMGDTRDNKFINMASGVELKFPVKFENIMLVPYAASSFALNVSPVFKEFPPVALGAGIQFNAKGGKRGAFFVDVKYMFSFTDAVMHNPYLSYSQNKRLYPEPSEIHYKRSVIGLGIGYKIGFLDRVKKVKPSPNVCTCTD